MNYLTKKLTTRTFLSAGGVLHCPELNSTPFSSTDLYPFFHQILVVTLILKSKDNKFIWDRYGMCAECGTKRNNDDSQFVLRSTSLISIQILTVTMKNVRY